MEGQQPPHFSAEQPVESKGQERVALLPRSWSGLVPGFGGEALRRHRTDSACLDQGRLSFRPSIHSPIKSYRQSFLPMPGSVMRSVVLQIPKNPAKK